jgi:hypothetical protein
MKTGFDFSWELLVTFIQSVVTTSRKCESLKMEAGFVNSAREKPDKHLY